MIAKPASIDILEVKQKGSAAVDVLKIKKVFEMNDARDGLTNSTMNDIVVVDLLFVVVAMKRILF